MPKIQSITCHKIVNSRGDWTIETKVSLDDGSEGVQAIPEGASKGEHEAVYIPVEKAVEIVSLPINDALKNEDPLDQDVLDNILISMDGTSNKRHLGGNSILSVSLAVAQAAAKSKGLELYEYLSFLYSGEKLPKKDLEFPIPVFNVLNGGKHAHNNLSFQEFMVIPAKGTPYDKCMEMGVDVYHELKKRLMEKGLDVNVGDEGGFAPTGFTVRKAFDFVRGAAKVKYKVGEELFLGADVAAGSFYNNEHYNLKEENLVLTNKELVGYHSKLLKDYELIYFEDPFYEKDTEGWEMFYEKMSKKLMVVADDLVVTNYKFLKKAIDKKLANAVIVKPNQVGTLTETFRFIREAKKAGMSVIVSHRSGDTAEDTFIADLALAVRADFIKAGAPVRGERVVKYNRLLDVFNQA